MRMSFKMASTASPVRDAAPSLDLDTGVRKGHVQVKRRTIAGHGPCVQQPDRPGKRRSCGSRRVALSECALRVRTRAQRKRRVAMELRLANRIETASDHRSICTGVHIASPCFCRFSISRYPVGPPQCSEGERRGHADIPAPRRHRSPAPGPEAGTPIPKDRSHRRCRERFPAVAVGSRRGSSSGSLGESC
jgi:hypothetical protein